MSFWDNVTGGASAPARPQAPVHPQQTQPWFRPEMPQHNPQGYPQQAPAFEQPPAGYPQTDPGVQSAMQRAPSSRSTLTCPNCFGGNVCKPSPNTMEQCYDCGWNPRFEHSTAGAGMPSSAEGGPAHPSRQTSTANNFNPRTFDPAQGGAGRMH